MHDLLAIFSASAKIYSFIRLIPIASKLAIFNLGRLKQIQTCVKQLNPDEKIWSNILDFFENMD